MAHTAEETQSERMHRWVHEVSQSEEFWASTPSWRPDSARLEVGGEQVVWSDAGLFTVHPVAGVVAGH